MKRFVENRKGLKIMTELVGSLESEKIAFITHGLSGSRNQSHIKSMADTLAEEGYLVVTFDTTSSFGESEGDSVDATTTSYIEDLEDIIAWASGESWYKEPFILAGHSLGSLASLTYASQHPHKVKALFPMSSVISGQLWREKGDKAFLKDWKDKGYYHKVSKSLPGKQGNVGWGLAEDLMKHDALTLALKIKCPVLLVVGSDDTGTSPKMHRMLKDRLKGETEMQIIEGMGHTPRNQQQLGEMQKILKQWLKKLP